MLSRLKSIIVPEFHTIRQLEVKGHRLFMRALTIGCVSLVVTFFIPYIFPLGIMGLVLAAVMFLIGMAWISWLGRGPSKHVYCPYCSTQNEVFMPRGEFNCDMCGRLSKLTEHGYAEATEEQFSQKLY